MKQRVLHLISSSFIGGPEKQILQHAFSMEGSPYQIEVGSFFDQPEPPEILHGAEAHNIPTVCLGGGIRLSLISELSRILNERPGVLLCTHGFKANFVGYFAARRTGTRHIAFLRGWTAENNRVKLYEVLERFALSRAPYVVCVSRRQAEQVARLRRGRTQPFVIQNAMFPPWSRPDKEQPVTRAALGISDDAFIFGSVGRLSIEKGHRFMIDAFHQVQAKLGDSRRLHLIVVGDGHEQPALEQQAAGYGLAGRVHFAGFQGNPERWMRLLDCLVQPSLTEGTPNSVLEAMYFNVPVIATSVGGVPDLITHGDNGLLAQPGDVDALSSAMCQIVLDADLRNRLAGASQQPDWSYSPAVQKEKLLAVYKTALAAPPGLQPKRFYPLKGAL